MQRFVIQPLTEEHNDGHPHLMVPACGGVFIRRKNYCILPAKLELIKCILYICYLVVAIFGSCAYSAQKRGVLKIEPLPKYFALGKTPRSKRPLKGNSI